MREERPPIGPAHLEMLASLVEAVRPEVLKQWTAEARRTLREAGWEPLHVVLARARREAEHVLQALPARLRTNPFGPQTAGERAAVSILAGAVPREAGRDVRLVAGYHLYYVLTHLLWRSICERLPENLSARDAEHIRAALFGALRRLLGVTPCKFVALVEERLRQQQRQLAEVYKRLLVAQEEERRRVARDVHDVLAQALAAARYRVETAIRLVETGDGDAKQELEEVGQLIEYTLERVRDIIFDLRPSSLDRFGLRTAIEDYVRRVQPDGPPKITVVGRGDPRRLPEETQAALFRIAQEGIWNAIRHSSAQQAEVIVDIGQTRAKLTIRDDGVGFDPEQAFERAASNGRYGLLGMRERAEMIGGKFTVRSAPGQGTEITVTVPLGSEANGGDGQDSRLHS